MAEPVKSTSLLLLKLLHSLSFLLRKKGPSGGFLVLHASLCAVFFTSHTGEPLGLLSFKLQPALFFLSLETLLVDSLFLLNSRAASIIVLNSLLTLFFFEADGFLALNLGLLKAPLPFKFVSLSLDSLFFHARGPLLFGSLGSEHFALSGFLLLTESLHFFLLLALLLFPVEHLFAQTELLLITLSLVQLSLRLLASVKFSQLSLNLRVVLIFFALQTSLLFFERLLASGILSLVLGSIGFIHGCELFLALCFVCLGLAASFLLFCS